MRYIIYCILWYYISYRYIIEFRYIYKCIYTHIHTSMHTVYTYVYAYIQYIQTYAYTKKYAHLCTNTCIHKHAHINNQTNQKNQNQCSDSTGDTRLHWRLLQKNKKKMSFEFLLEQVNSACLPNLSWETVPKERGLVGGTSTTCWYLVYLWNDQEAAKLGLQGPGQVQEEWLKLIHAEFCKLEVESWNQTECVQEARVLIWERGWCGPVF